MGYSETNYYDGIIKRQIRSGRATSKSEVIHQALELLDSLTRGGGPPQRTFDGPEDLKRLLREGLASGPAVTMTEDRWAKITGRPAIFRHRHRRRIRT
jgi:Arc/MetJ-type ribon-helix-helix transcriptional regulator